MAPSPAQALRDLAEEPVHAGRAVHLQQLAAAVDGGPGASGWAELDVLRVLDVDGPLADVREESARAQHLEMLRSVLVFCPLLVTWLGLFLAGRAYEALVSVDPTARQLPFLKLWLTGFEGNTWLTLDRVAVATVTLVMALIVASVALEHQRGADERAFTQVTQDQRRRLRAAATAAQLALHGHRLSSPERFRAELTRTSSAFAEVVREVTAVSDAAARTLVAMTDVAHSIGAASERGQSSAEAVAAAARDLTSTVTGMEHLVERVGAELSGSVRLGSADVSSAVQTSSQWVVGAAEALLQQSDQALSHAEQTFDRVARAVGELHARVESLHDREAVTAELATAAETVVQHAVPLRDAVAQLHAVVAGLAAAGAAGHQPLLTAAQSLDAAARRLVQLAPPAQHAPAAQTQPAAHPLPLPQTPSPQQRLVPTQPAPGHPLASHVDGDRTAAAHAVGAPPSGSSL